MNRGKRTTSYKVLKYQPQYLKLLVADLINRFGDSIDTIAFNWMMYQITQSASMMAIILACTFIPSIVIQPFAAVFVEEKKKRNIMVVCDICRSIIVGGTIILYMNHSLNSLSLILITFMSSTFEAIRSPANTAIIPKVLEKDKYSVGISLDNSLSSAIQIAGMALAGTILAFYGIPGALLIDAVTFLLSAVIINCIRYVDHLEKKHFSYKSYFRQMTNGLQYLRQSKLILYIAFFGAFLNFALTPNNAFDSAYISANLDLGPESLSFAGISMMCGMSIGTFFTPKLQKCFKGKNLVLFNGVLTSLSFLLMGFLPMFDLPVWKNAGLVFSQFLIGATVNLQNVIFNVAFISNMKEEYISRVTGLYRAIVTSAIPLSSIVCSGLALIMRMPTIFLLFSLFMLLTYVFSFFIKEFCSL